MQIESIEFLNTHIHEAVINGLERHGQVAIATPMLVGNIDNGHSAFLIIGTDRNKIIKRLIFDLLDLNDERITATNCSIISTDDAIFEIDEESENCRVTLDINMQEENCKEVLTLTRNLSNDYLEVMDNFHKGKTQGDPIVYFNPQKYGGATVEDVKHSFEKVVSAWCYGYILYFREEITGAPCLYAEDGTVWTRLPVDSVETASGIRATNHPNPQVLVCDGGELNFM